MKQSIILDLCGGTGSWSQPFREKFHVIVASLPTIDVRLTAIGDEEIYFKAPSGMLSTTVKIKDVYGILAAPPCTMFSKARTNAIHPRDFEKGMETVRACLHIIWRVQESGNLLAFWALENPKGYLRRFLGNPAYTFEPWWFGDRHTKATDLWGYFNEPKKLLGAVKPAQEWEAIKAQDGYTRTEVRAITPPHFAQAFYEANK